MKSSIICPSNVIRMIELKRMRWVGYVTDILEIRNVNNLDIKLKERDHFEDLGKDGG
jgi:hypothetical protein